MKFITILMLFWPISLMANIEFNSGNHRISFDTQRIQLTVFQEQQIVYQTNFSKRAKLNSFAIKPIWGAWQSAQTFVEHYQEHNKHHFKLLTKKRVPITLSIITAGDDFKLQIKSSINCKEIRINSRISTSGHWYGEGETVSRIGVVPILRGKMKQSWPLSSGQVKRKPFATTDNSSVLVPLWLASKGVAIFSDSYHYLHERFNVNKNDIFSLAMIRHKTTHPTNTFFSLDFLLAENIVAVYKKWIHRDFTHKKAWNRNNPLPPYQMFAAPIWTTWVEYKKKISQKTILDFAKKIMDSKLPYGILEIDDKWQQQYGKIGFDSERFFDPLEMVNWLRENSFEVSVWMPPFVNQDHFENIKPNSVITTEKGSPHLTSWWDTMYLKKNSGVFNFFDPDFKQSFIEEISDFTEQYNLLGVKYDAGESNYLPQLKEHHPNSYSDRYIDRWREMKALEFRAATFSQHHAPIVREFDKNSSWDNYTGLKSVLTQALAIGIVGYPFVLPDMVGGNKYPFSNLTDELYIRWLQLNTFMPMIQLSLGPWNFSSQTQKISARYLAIHQDLVPYIWQQVKLSNQTGMPMVRPLFFEFPEDKECYPLADQFMLGDRYLVAPVLNKKEYKRNIYLPQGTWKDYWSEKTFEGGQWIENYPTPLETIPVFVRN